MEQLIAQFIDRYLSRGEIIHRLPVSVPIRDFWPALQSERRKRAIPLPLLDQSGRPFWFVLNRSVESQCDRVARLARRDAVFDSPAFAAMFEDAVIDEAVFSSMIEGAFTSREAAIGFLRRHRKPVGRSEQMVRNNYDALTYVLEHLDEPVRDETVIEIAKIVTRSASDVQVTGYRTGPVIVAMNDEVVYTPPAPQLVPEMMASLFRFLRESELHPVLKACVAHFYFVYVHPFGDGNGRTARALSFMLLLQSGYDFFRYFSISSLIAKERGKYYKSILNVEESESDMTYFIDFYSGMLARSVEMMEDHLTHHVLVDETLKTLEKRGDLRPRQLKGARWVLESGNESVTVEIWKKKFQVTTETARKDLLTLCECGILDRQMRGRTAVFLIRRAEP